MARKLKVRLSAVVLGTALMLSGCVHPGGTADRSGVQQLQRAVVAACGWLPVAETIVSLIPGLPSPGALQKIADAICAKLKSTPTAASRRGITEVTLDNGVTVRGSFVRAGR
jgi:hypothetical protein